MNKQIAIRLGLLISLFSLLAAARDGGSGAGQGSGGPNSVAARLAAALEELQQPVLPTLSAEQRLSRRSVLYQLLRDADADLLAVPPNELLELAGRLNTDGDSFSARASLEVLARAPGGRDLIVNAIVANPAENLELLDDAIWALSDCPNAAVTARIEQLGPAANHPQARRSIQGYRYVLELERRLNEMPGVNEKIALLFELIDKSGFPASRVEDECLVGLSPAQRWMRNRLREFDPATAGVLLAGMSFGCSLENCSPSVLAERIYCRQQLLAKHLGAVGSAAWASVAGPFPE